MCFLHRIIFIVKEKGTPSLSKDQKIQITLVKVHRIVRVLNLPALQQRPTDRFRFHQPFTVKRLLYAALQNNLLPNTRLLRIYKPKMYKYSFNPFLNSVSFSYSDMLQCLEPPMSPSYLSPWQSSFDNFDQSRGRQHYFGGNPIPVGGVLASIIRFGQFDRCQIWVQFEALETLFEKR